MKKQRMFSVIIPAYNPGNKIFQLLDTMLKLKRGYDLEVIVIDDGSDFIDELRMKECVEKGVIYKRFENKGVSIARNEGLEFAHGDYLTFFDSDDLIDINALSNVLDKITAFEDDIDIFMYAYSMIDEQKNTDVIPPFAEGYYSKNFLQKLKIRLVDVKFSRNYKSSYIGGKVYQYFVSRKLFFEGGLRFCENQRFAEDLCYCMTMFDMADSLFIFHDIAYLYYVNNGSASHKYRPNLWNEWYSVYKYVDLFLDNNILKNRLLYWASKSSIRHIITYEQNNRISRKKVSDIIYNDELRMAMDNLNFNQWTINEKIENFLMKTGNTYLLFCFEILITKLKSRK